MWKVNIVTKSWNTRNGNEKRGGTSLGLIFATLQISPRLGEPNFQRSSSSSLIVFNSIQLGLAVGWREIFAGSGSSRLDTQTLSSALAKKILGSFNL